MSYKQSQSNQNRRIGSVIKYVENLSTKANTLFRIKSSGESCFVIDGVEVSVNEVNKMFPTDGLLSLKSNVDTRNLWMSA